MDEIDRLLIRAGDEWRATQPPPPPVDARWFMPDVPRPALVASFLAGAAGAAIVAALALVAVGAGDINLGGGPGGPPPTAAPRADSCPVTKPVPVFTPPDRWPAEAAGDREWYGSTELWTALPRQGVRWRWSDPWPRDEHGISDKSFWWSADYTSSTDEPQPRIRVTALRLDGEGFSVTEPPGTNAAAPDIGLAMLTGLNIPSPGCWQVTGEYRGRSLSYVMLVVDD